MKKHWKIAVLANLKKDDESKPANVPHDAFADYDSIETVNALRTAMETDGHTTTFIHADKKLPYALRDEKPDICFNLAEGLGGDAREAQVPALLEMLGIPYTGSRVLSNGISLDKTLTKRIWRDNGLPVAHFQEFTVGDEPLLPELTFPLFVKPAYGGTGMGVDMNAILQNEKELRERVVYLIHAYQQPALVETFLSGREFTVGVLGRSDAKLYSRKPEWYDNNGFHYFPVLELDTVGPTETWVYGNEAKSKDVGPEDSPGYFCPADIDQELEKSLKHLALRAHQTIYALDVSRSDIRLDAEGKPCLIEINTIPGMTPNYSDLCLQAKAEGMDYNDLILDILYLGASRWGMIEPKKDKSL